MKKSLFILSGMLLAALAWAQSNSTVSVTNVLEGVPDFPGLQTNPPAGGIPATDIHAHSGYFDLKTDTSVSYGDVQIIDPKLRLNCEWIRADWSSSPSNKFETLTAVTNVVMSFLDSEGKTNHTTSAKLVYTYGVTNSMTNEMAILTGTPETGTPRLETSDGKVFLSDPLIWDFILRRMYLTNYDIKAPSSGTNGLDFMGKQPPASKKSPGTNAPGGHR